LKESLTNASRSIKSDIRTNETVRIYILDQMILSLILREGYAYAATLAQQLNRTQRTINKHLHKLEELNIVERHGSKRCPFQWYSINEYARKETFELILFLQGRYITKDPKKNQYLTFKMLLDHAHTSRLIRLYSMDMTFTITLQEKRARQAAERPFDHSVPWVPFCKNFKACPFPICIRYCNPRDPAEAAILKRSPFRGT
jgi:DNA-binding MarR family transcriptional regulator